MAEVETAGQPAPQPNTQRGRLARRFTVATAGRTERRRIATIFAVVVAGLLGYHAFFGANGLSAYNAKRQEDRALAGQLEQLRQQNSRLRMHVDHLKSDPDAIEYEAHTRLRYTRPDQVIVLNNTPGGETALPPRPQPRSSAGAKPQTTQGRQAR